MSKRKNSRSDRNDRREELLRPSQYLGYDRDRLGMYLLSRGAYRIAESQFRRAIWLNPYEYRFVCHLAWCLFREGNLDEAKKYAARIDKECAQTDEQARIIIERIEQAGKNQ